MVKFIKQTFIEDSGKPSYRHLTAFVFVLLSIYTLVFKIPNKDIITAFLYELIFILVVSGYITADKILSQYIKSK